MSTVDDQDLVVRRVRPERQTIVRDLLRGAPFDAPVVSSFSMSGLAAVSEAPPASEAVVPAASAPDRPARRGRRARRRSQGGDGPRTVSRRRLFGLLGGAAAAGAGFAVAGSALDASPAGASNLPMLIGAINNANSSQTSLTSFAGSATFLVSNTATTAFSRGLVTQSIAPQLQLVNPNMASRAGPPNNGGRGDVYTNAFGELWFCTAGGTPGTWVRLSSPFVPIAPARVYDSRPGLNPLNSSPKTPIPNGGTVDVDITNNSSGVPSTAQAVLGNLTVMNTQGFRGSFLTVFAQGSAQPSTSNINWAEGQVLANSFTTKINPANGLITVACTGGPTDFTVDLFGYYP
jgi:hypothetical protein